MNKSYDQRGNQGKIYNADQITINEALAPPQAIIGIPENIPYIGTEIFVGRVKELEKIDELLSNDQPLAITSVIGMGGIGKTELALQYALRYQQNYQGGICWVEAKRSDVSGQIISFAQSSVNVIIPDHLQNINERLRYCWSHWKEGTVLLIFDDVENYNNIKNSLPPKNEKFKVIVTSRQKLGRLQQLKLEVLEPNEALTLLIEIIGEERINEELETAKELCKWLGYLPLGLELVGRYLIIYDKLTLNKALERLNKKQLQATALLDPEDNEADMTAQLGIASAFELSWEKLSPEGKKLGCYLSLFGSELFDWSWVESSHLYPNEDEEEEIEELEKLRDKELRNFNLLQSSKQTNKKLICIIYYLIINHLYQLTFLSLLYYRQENAKAKPLYSYHPLISYYFKSKLNNTDNSNFIQLKDKEELKHKFCKSLISVAQSIDDTPTLKDIKKFSISVPHLEMIAIAMRDKIDDEDIIFPFIGLGRFYQGQTNYQEAEKWYKDCLLICKERFGNEHELIAASMNNIAMLYSKLGRYCEAESLLKEGLKINQNILDNKHCNVTVMKTSLAGVYESQGKYQDAENLYEEVLYIQTKLLGQEHPHLFYTINNLSGLYNLQGKYEKVEPLLLKALLLSEKLFGNQNYNTAIIMQNLGAFYNSQERYKESEDLLEKALSLLRTLLGDEHPDIALCLNNLASLYHSQKKYKQAENLFKEAINIRKKLLGNIHPHIATAINNLALLYKLQKKYKDAQILYLESIKILEVSLGEDHLWTVTAKENYQIMLDEMS